ncbi:hypothetical protein DDP54_10870 [Cellulomonas sp. WB94]|uniref:DUF4012 domain-containing protein n=1 Tax=Cellulomonas sp. WB94 TaxID=2173174 RepID=UPI000D577546|nr:DUF4012 domain-containing protein [Cellulomonas sp. WB94]PVU83416.1 hypothetical protein DDP54_10870 [Cellulomonas sp. WB94]
MRGSRRVRITLRVSAGVLGLVLVAGGWLGYRGLQAEHALRSVGDVVGNLESDIAAGRTKALADKLPAVQADAERARSATSDPVWRLAEHLPLVGDDLAAVRTVAAAVDDVARDALPAISQLGTVLGAQEVRGTDGRIDLQPLVDAAPTLALADSTTVRARDAVDAIDTSSLMGRIAGPVVKVQKGLGKAAAALDAASKVATLLPSMLGADGPRTYLLLSLNSAELRSAGGIVGAVAVLHAENGSIDLVEQRTTLAFPPTEESVLPLTPDELLVHTDRLGRWIQDTVFTPDFPRTAQLVSAIWERSTGQTVDGVVATDPVAAKYLLSATGTIAAPDGVKLRASNLLSVLLHDSYLSMQDPAVADEFYTGVAATIFRAVGSGQGDSRDVVEQLAKAGEERRVRIWSAHPDEQGLLAPTSLSGGFLSGSDDAAAGVFLNDGTAGKLDYYLTTAYSVESMTCGKDGFPGAAVVRLDLAYDPPADVATYPMYVTGYHGDRIATGSVQTNVTVYSPVGGSISEQALGDELVGGLAATESGRVVSVLTSRLDPGGRATYRFTFPVVASTLDVWTTPTLTSPGLVEGTCTPAP